MRKLHVILVLSFISLLSLNAQSIIGGEELEGFNYGRRVAPEGDEWQKPESLSLNKLQPHSWFFSFKGKEEALNILPEHSSYWQSLNGSWKFHWASDPEKRPMNFYECGFDDSSWDEVTVPMNWNVAGIQKDGSLKYGTPIYSNQRVIFKHSVKVDDWKGGVMREAPADWVTYKDRNEVGSYRRSFTVPEEWEGREVILNFDGVDNFFYLYVNGKYVGYSTNSRNLAAFTISEYLTSGENLIAVEVYRHSSASFLESQDMMRLPGIFRDVYLTSKPKNAQIYDIAAIPNYDATYTNASLKLTTHLIFGNKTPKELKLRYSLYEMPLYGDGARKKIEGVGSEFVIKPAKGSGSMDISGILEAGDKVKPWNAENPQRYALVGELLDSKGRVIETVSTVVGFRKIEIKDTAAEDDEFGLAGRYYYLNGKPVKMKGVNRHETNAFQGHALSRDWMEKEVMLMKRANINHVRNSHYPDAPYWYYLCDKYGIMLEDEANIESHQYYYGEASLSHVPEFLNAHVARNMEMVHSRINHPSVCIWSLGNEAGPGDNFVKAYKAIKRFDCSRPVQYERNNHIVDMGSNQYPSIPWVQEAVKGQWDLVYPFHISEYGHSMGNAVGNLIDYWEAIESTNFFMGGAIWEWIDHGLWAYTPDGTRYMAYGGDFGDKPNDGMFCMDGIMQADLSPKAQYFEVKKVYQNVGVKAVDMTKGKIEIFNKNYFEPLNQYKLIWSLWKDGVCVQKEPLEGVAGIAPRSRAVFTLPYNYAELDPQGEYFVKVQFLLAEDMPWAESGYVQMEEQLAVKSAEAFPALSESANTGAAVEVTETEKYINISNEVFLLSFDRNTGNIHSLEYGPETIITAGNGPKLDAYRAPTDNDAGIGYHNAWFRNGLYDLSYKAKDMAVLRLENGCIQISATIECKAEYGNEVKYSNRDRNPEDVYSFETGKKALGERGLSFIDNIIYTVYPDGSIEVNSAISASSTAVVLPRIGYAMKLESGLSKVHYYGRGPVNNYNDRKTAQFIELHSSAVEDMGIMLAKPQSMGNREEVRWCAITNPAGRGVVFAADGAMSSSVLPWSQQEMTLAAHPHQLPESSGTVVHLDAKVTGLGGASCGQGGPLAPDRTISGDYSFSFAIRPVNLGRAAAALINETAKVSLCGARPEFIRHERKADALKVVFCSSEEPEEGQAANMVDGDEGTIWHTIYSITLAKYPHWVDFDAGKEKVIKGFTYTPRQNGSNGDVKEYDIFTSTDGEKWTPVHKGIFSRNKETKEVLFKDPVKARYIRFRALSEQNGQEYASCAEFGLIE